MLPRKAQFGLVSARIRSFALVAGLGLSIPIASGTDYYVSPSGSDASPGTIAEPFATLQHAAATAQPGDTVFLRAGTYRQVVDYSILPGGGNSGTAGNEIVMKPYPSEAVTISGFDEVIAGQGGAGTWTQHSANIWKISLTAAWALETGKHLVLVDGVIQQEARWPNVTDPFDFDYRNMAFNETSSIDLGSIGPQAPYPGNDFYTATYGDNELPVLPDGTWAGAMIDLAPGSAAQHGSGVVTDSTGTTLEFRYQRDEISDVGDNDSYYLWNNLAALDQAGEAFFDSEGVSGPAYTLYVWSPEGDPDVYHQVEFLQRPESIVVRDRAYLRFENFNILGGRINCKSDSSFVTFQGINVRYAGAGLNLLSAVRTAVSLDGTDSVIRDCYVGHTFGNGVQARNLDNIVENNVIRRCKENAVGTWGGHNILVNRNTVAETGRAGIAMFSTAGEFNYNHCYLAGMRLPDEAVMNTNGADVDRLDTEVSYNWVHHNIGRSDPSKGMSGGRGIRLDGGGGGVYNMLIHHNIVWQISGGPCLDLWTLPVTSAAYGNSQTRAFNNSTDGEMKFQGGGSMGGHDIRNNIAERFTIVGHGKESATLSSNLLFGTGFNPALWPGNIFDPPNFVSGATANFYLDSSSAGIDGGVAIPPVTDGFSGPAPDIGALEYTVDGARVWSAGGIILPADVPQLTLELTVTDGGEREVRVGNIPEGRVLPDEFQLQLGAVVTDHVAYEYSITTHQATGIVRFLTTPPQEEVQPVSISTDSGTTWIPMGTFDVPPPGVSIKPAPPITSTTTGGGTAVLGIHGLISQQKLIPVDIIRSLPADLLSKPVPLVVDTRNLISSGEMNADGSNVRFRTSDGAVELDYWIESGLDSPSTLFWIRHKPGAAPTGEQIYLALEDPASPPVSDPTIITAYYPVLEDPSLCVWYSANSIAGSHTQGAPVANLPDLGARGHDATNAIASTQPSWNEVSVAGLPTVYFDGNDHLYAGTVSPITPPKVSFIVVHRNEIGADDGGRTWSSGTGVMGQESAWSEAGATEDIYIERSARRNSNGDLVKFTLGKKAAKTNRYFNGDIAELLVFDVELGNPGPFSSLQDYVSRKYTLKSEARGVARTADTVEPATLFVDGQQITNFTILANGDVQFTIPAGSGTLPKPVDIDLVFGAETAPAPHSLVYYEPAYDAWAAPLVPTSEDPPNLDIENDALENLIEFACDLDPENYDSTPCWLEEGTGGMGEDVLHLYLRRSSTADDALLIFEKSVDLQSWQQLYLDDLGFAIYDADPDGDGSAILYRAELPAATDGLETYRLKAELLP